MLCDVVIGMEVKLGTSESYVAVHDWLRLEAVFRAEIKLQWVVRMQ